MPKFWQNTGKLGKEKKLYNVPNPKVHAKPPILGNYTIFKEICLLSVFQNVRHQNDK